MADHFEFLILHSESPCYKHKNKLTLLKNRTRRYNFPITLPVEEQTSWFCNDDSVPVSGFLQSILIYSEPQRSHEPQLLPELIPSHFKVIWTNRISSLLSDLDLSLSLSLSIYLYSKFVLVALNSGN